MRKWLYSIALLGVISVIIIVLLFEQNDRFRQGVYKTMIAENQIPEEYVPIYQEASDEYGIPWELLASVHRVETIFSTMDSCESSRCIRALSIYAPHLGWLDLPWG
ncbi:hypothetical protein [Bacillus sp. JCM 19041]|uniref:hypothetical protein n=1 Tax=Bacillus sp. JCM 19041 TaxID=1460637 RepID=UPI000B278A3C